ncbi:sensor histidine kinase [Falsiroseomonas sp. HW251]|uniref:sensor histidine kinase n=1 Tax=Falsiroseomonas sp. HW251 TaxID=3390998 RepID=UPI003D31E396
MLPPSVPPPGAPARLAFRSLWLAAVGLPLLAFAAGAWISWREIESEARQRLLRSVDMLHEHALRSFETQEAQLTALEARIAGMDWVTMAESEALHRFLVRLTESTPFLAGFGLVDPQGRMVASSAGPTFPLVPTDQGARDYVLAHQRYGVASTYLGEQVVAAQTRRRLFTFSRAWRAAEGEPPGVIVAAFSSDGFSRFYASVAESGDDRIALVRTDGALLARHPPTPGPMRFPADAPIMRALASGAGGAMTFDAPSAVDGVPRLNAVRQVGDYPAAIIYGIGPATLRAALWQRLLPLGGMAGVAAALLLGLTAMAQGATRREAEALSRAAAESEAARSEAEARAAAEQRLRQAERSAALGRIAAGVAHDMNNLVQAVLASALLLQRRAETAGEVRRIAGLLDSAAARGQRVARRLLGFGRPAPQPPEGFRPAEVLAGLDELMGGLMGSGMRLEIEAAAGLPPLSADRAEFETVLLNLAVNARDAMGGTGVVRIRAAPAELGAGPHAAAQPWVRVSVADTGSGMPEAVLKRVGEPFFTTKPEGEGTGLGLMMARQFAEGAGGTLTIESREGEGTVVSLWLPATKAAAMSAAV